MQAPHSKRILMAALRAQLRALDSGLLQGSQSVPMVIVDFRD